MEELNLELVLEPKVIKRKNSTSIKPNPEPVAEMDTDIILEHIADIEKEIKEHKIRGPKSKAHLKPAKIQKPELEPTQIIFIKGPIILDFEEN